MEETVAWAKRLARFSLLVALLLACGCSGDGDDDSGDLPDGDVNGPAGASDPLDPGNPLDPGDPAPPADPDGPGGPARDGGDPTGPADPDTVGGSDAAGMDAVVGQDGSEPGDDAADTQEAGPDASAGDAAVDLGADASAEDAGAPPPDAVDPGTGPWEPVPQDQVEETCNLDTALLAEADATLNAPWAVVRYGRLCHEFYPPGETPTTTAEVFSTTKTLGALVTGIASYETRNIPRTDRKTGQLLDWDRVDHWLDSFSYNPDAHVAHVLAMVGHNEDLSYGNKQHAYDTVGDVQINTLSDMVNTAISQDPERLGANIEEFTQRFLYEPLGMTLSSWTDGAVDKVYAYTWSSSVREMARVGLLILNRGWWNGRRVLDESWIYKMTHPAFEDGNTSYGYLTWLGSWSNHSIGFSPPTGQGPSVPCAPAALWNFYPHGELSEAPNCNYEPPYSCDQDFDAGVWQGVGMGGNVIQGHPGLDMVLVVRNELLGGAGLWPAVQPAVIAGDPTYAGDQGQFCEAYANNRHAPDLRPWSVFQ